MSDIYLLFLGKANQNDSESILKKSSSNLNSSSSQFFVDKLFRLQEIIVIKRIIIMKRLEFKKIHLSKLKYIMYI